MNFNYGYEKKLFEKEWSKKKVLMKEAGMKDEEIQQMYEFDWEWFKNIRRYQNHTIDIQIISELADTKPIEAFRDTGLVEQLSDLKLINAIKSLKPKELELLEKIIIEDKKQIDIAKEKDMSKSWINEQFKALMIKIKRLMDNE